MNTYWLSRGPGQPAEGPLTLAQIQGMLVRNLITDQSFVCPVESSEWRGVNQELAEYQSELPQAQPVRQRSWEKPIDRPDEGNPEIENLGKTANWVMVGFLGISCVPGLFSPLFVLAAVATGSVLSIMIMTKGEVGKGVRLLICFLVGMPLLMLLGKIVSGLLTGALR